MDENKIPEIVEKMAEIDPDIKELEIKVCYNDTPAQIYKGVVTFDRNFVRSETEDVIAFVIGHEYAHHIFSDGKSSGKARGKIVSDFFETFEESDAGFFSNLAVGLVKGLIGGLLYCHESRMHEKRADLTGAVLSVLAGYSKEEAVKFLKYSGSSNGIFSTHPEGRDRANFLDSAFDKFFEKFTKYMEE